jgi:predicted dehydrogenase
MMMLLSERWGRPTVNEHTGADSPLLKVGIVGWGWMGQVHARAYARLRHHYPEAPLRPALVAFADNAVLRFRGGALGILESSRASVGEQCTYGIEVHGARGALSWDFRRMGELQLCLDQDYQNASSVLTTWRLAMEIWHSSSQRQASR